jgi:Protein of unknown function (DUF2523)
MPVFLASLLGGLISITATLAGRVLLALGIGMVSYTGLSFTIDFAKAQAISALQATGADVVGMLSTMQVGTSISIIFSAMLARLVLQGLTSDTIKNMVFK